MISRYGAALIVSGIKFEVDAFLKRTSIEPLSVFYRNSLVIGPDQTKVPRPDSGFILLVPEDERKPLQFHIQKAVELLNSLGEKLKQARSFGADDLRLNFFSPQLDVYEQSQYLPPELLRLTGNLGAGIELSLMQYERR